MELAALIDALSKPAAYPHPVDRVEVVQTHISVVFRAGPFVYKVKKPVQPGFLDFSTLEKRRFFCEEEVRLNRRLAPDVYLGVVPVTAEHEQVRFEGAGGAIEWAVKMVRLPDEATLHARLERGEGDIEQAANLAHRIAAFHRQAASAARAADFAAVSRNILDVLEQSAAQVDVTVAGPVHERLSLLTKERLDQLRPLIEARAARGVTRDCHGDLHLDHVYLFPDRAPPGDLVIVDCIEFNERFRFIDPVADIAFAAMDFIYHGRRDLARAFCDAYFRDSGDHEGRAILDLYMAYRALVRAYVDRMKAQEPEVLAAERRRAQASSEAHWLLALRQLEGPSRRSCLLLIGGLPGTGKSTLARALAKREGFQLIRSDEVRKNIAAEWVNQNPSASASLYSDEWTTRTYMICRQSARYHLLLGERVLIDATFRKEAPRRWFLDTAAQMDVPARLLICQADPAIVRSRLAMRRNDASGADWSIHEQLAAIWEPLGSDTATQTTTIDTSGELEASVRYALEALVRLGLRESL